MDIAYFNKNGDPKYGRIFVQAGSIGLECGSKVCVMPLEKWVEMAWLDPPLNVGITKCVHCGAPKP